MMSGTFNSFLRLKMRRLILVIGAFGSSLVFTACSDHPSEKTIQVSGMVSLGPVDGATVKAFNVNQDGSRGSELGQGTTDANGKYSLDLPAQAQDRPMEIVATGGTYEEEASGAEVEVGSEEMVALVGTSNNRSEVAVTVLTDIAAERAKSLVQSGVQVDEAVNAAKTEIQEASGIPDIHTPPANPYQASTSDSEAKKKYALVLAGLSELAKNKEVNSLQMARALAQDFKKDAKFDCVADASGAPVDVKNSAQILTGKEWSEELATSMNSMKNNSARILISDVANLTPPAVTNPQNIRPEAITASVTAALPTATKLSLSSPPKIPVNVCAPLIMKVTDANGGFAPNKMERILSLGASNASTVKFYSEPSCQNELSGFFTFPAIIPYAHTFMKASSAGAVTVTVSDSNTSPTGLVGTGRDIEFFALANPGTAPASLPPTHRLNLILPNNIPATSQACLPANVSLTNSGGFMVPSASDLEVTLAVTGSSAGAMTLFKDSSCGTSSALTTSKIITIPAGRPAAHFFLNSNSAGAFTITASAGTSSTLVAPSNQASRQTTAVTVTNPSFTPPKLEIMNPSTAPYKIVILGPPSAVPTNRCLPYLLQAQQTDGRPVPSDSERNVTLTIGSGQGAIFSDPGCLVAAASNIIKIPKFLPGQTAFVKWAAGGTTSLSARVSTPDLPSSQSSNFSTTVYDGNPISSLPNGAQPSIRLAGPSSLPFNGCSPIMINVVDSITSMLLSPTIVFSGNLIINPPANSTVHVDSSCLSPPLTASTNLPISTGMITRPLFIKGNRQSLSAPPMQPLPQTLEISVSGWNDTKRFSFNMF